MKVALVQYDIAWHRVAENKARITRLIKDTEADLFVLPEMYSSGFSMKPESFSEKEQIDSLEFLQSLAKEKQAAIVASIIQGKPGDYRNRLFFVQPNGSYEHYDKRHLFTFAKEQNHYSAGDKRLISKYMGQNINPLICYDLRFPVFSRNSADQAFNLQIYVANWPQARVAAWDALLKARAIENQCYVIGVNRVGKDANEIQYNGHSAVIDPYGSYMIEPIDNEECVASTELDFEELNRFRAKFPVLHDADAFKLL